MPTNFSGKLISLILGGIIFLIFPLAALAAPAGITVKRLVPSLIRTDDDLTITLHLVSDRKIEGVIEDTVPLGFQVKQPKSGPNFKQQLLEKESRLLHWDVSFSPDRPLDLSYQLSSSSPVGNPILGPLKLITATDTIVLEADPYQLRYSLNDTLTLPSQAPEFTFRRLPLVRSGSGYLATLELTANSDFNGSFEEIVPQSLFLKPSTQFSSYQAVVETETNRMIIWNLSLKAGQKTTLAYRFHLLDSLSAHHLTVGPSRVTSTGGQPLFVENSVTTLSDSTFNIIDRIIFFLYRFYNQITGGQKSSTSLTKSTYRIDENVELNVTGSAASELSVSLISSDGVVVETNKQYLAGRIIIKKPRQFIPGKYQLLVRDGERTDYRQDFSWGVLAVNTNKSIYLPNETADIALAVLDNFGAMVCDAQISLTITSPDLKTTTLTTQDGTIIVNPECQVHNYTTRPDYQTQYKTSQAGDYGIELTAITKNGTYSITDNFQVKNSVDFDLSRNLATRIFPIKPYPVNFDLTVNRDFTGVIEESVPASFEIFPLPGVLKYSTQSKEGDTIKLSWNVNLKKGDKLKLGYSFDAPDISPQYYLLGPIRFVEVGGQSVFQEIRPWQIASDALAKMLLYWDGSAASVPAGWSCVSCATTDPFYHRFLRGGTGFSSLAGGTEFHIHADPGTITSGAVNIGGTIRGSVSTATAYAPENTHTHTATVVGSGLSGPNLPAYIDLLVIQYNAGVPQNIPAGALSLFDAAAPSGWTPAYNNNQYIRGSGTTQTTLQSANTHVHSITTSLTSVEGVGTTRRGHATSTRYVAGVGRSHPPGTANSSSGSNEPPRMGTVLAKKDSSGEAPIGLIAMFTDLPPSGNWTYLSNSGGPFYNRFAKMTGTYNSESSDTNTHSHTATITTGSYTAPNTRMGTSNTYRFGTTSHTHTFTNIPLADVSSQLPPYSDVLIAKLGSAPAPNLDQIHFHWRNDNGSETTASSQTLGVEDTNPATSDASVNHRLRLEISNEGTAAFNGKFRLEYGLKSTTCSAISTWVDVGAASGDWDIYDSTNLTQGADTTNIAVGNSGGVTDANPTFKTPNSGLVDVGSTTPTLDISAEDFIELEYSIKANASSGSYCFRVTNVGSTANFTYTRYPEATIASNSIAVQGTCLQSDKTTDCTDTGTIRVAINDSLQAQTQPTVAGSWSINNVSIPTLGDVITVYIENAADDREAVAVTKYDGSGDIRGLKLIESYLSIGSSDSPTISNLDLQSYDYTASGQKEDIFYESSVSDFNSCTFHSGSCITNGLYVHDATYRPRNSTPSSVNTYHFILDGDLTPDSTEFNVIGDLIFSPGSSHTIDQSTFSLMSGYNNTQHLSGDLSFYHFSVLVDEPSRIIETGVGSTLTVDGNFSLTGADCNNLLIFRSSTPGSPFYLDNQSAGSTQFSYLDLQDVHSVSALTVSNSVDSGGNNNITFFPNSCLGASTNTKATAYSFQRKTFYDSSHSVFWQLFHDGTEIETKYSSDATTWNSAGQLPYNTNDFSVWNQNIGSTEYLFLAVTSGYDILLRRGVLSSSGVTWDSQANLTPFNGSEVNDAYSRPHISLDSSNYPWLSARHYNGSTYDLITIKAASPADSSFSSFSWNDPITINSSVGSSQVYSSITPLSDQNMYSAFVSGTTILGCYWNNSSQDWLNTSNSSCLGSGLVPDSQSISTSTSINAYGSNLQRKNWFDGTRYWSAFNSNNRIEFWYSSDGKIWTENTSARLSHNTTDFSLSAGTSAAYIIYSVANTASVRQAASYPSTSFSWGDAAGVHQPASSTSIIQDTNDHLWVSLIENLSVDPIVSFNFESGNFTGWSENNRTGVGTTNEVIAAAANGGTYGLHQSVLQGNNGWANVGLDIGVSSGNIVYATFDYQRNSISGNGVATFATFFNSTSFVRMLSHIYNNGTDYAVIRKRDGADQTVAFGTNLSADQWYEIALSLDYSGANPIYKIFVDGEEQATYTDTSSGTLLYPDIFYAGTQEYSWLLSTDIYYDNIAFYDQDPYLGSGRNFLAIGSSTANSPSAWVTPAILKNTESTNLYGSLIPRSSGSLASVWIDGDSIQSRLFVGTTWASSATTIATGSTLSTTSLSAVGDTGSGAVHLAYVDPAGSLKYTRFVDTWGTAVTLDSGSSSRSPVLSIGTGTTGSVSLSWFNNQSLYQKQSSYPYGSSNWSSSPTSILADAANYSLSSSYYISSYPLLTWISGSTSPYSVSSYLTGTSWYDSDWSYRQKIILNNSQIGGTGLISDFVMLISSTYPEWKSVANGGHVAQSDGGDFVFTTGIGGTKLDHEIESYDPATGQLVVWIRIPEINPVKENRIYLYYGNSDAADQWNTNGGVWVSDYQSVWHLTEEQSGVGTTDVYLDSSGNNYHVDDQITSVDKPTRIGSGQGFVATNSDYLTAGNLSYLSGITSLTLSAWVKRTSASTYSAFIGKQNAGGTAGVGLILYSDGNLYFGLSSGTPAYGIAPLNDTNWHHVVMVYDGSASTNADRLKGYVDGSQVTLNFGGTTIPSQTVTDTTAFEFGRQLAGSLYATGSLDEVRVLTNNLNTNQILTEFHNQNSPSTFYSIGSEVEVPVGSNPDIIDDQIPAADFSAFSLVSDLTDTVHIAYLDDNTTDQISFKSLTVGHTWPSSPLQLESSDTSLFPNLSIDSTTNNPYLFWIDAANDYVYYRSCDLSAATSACSVGGDWASETAFKTSGYNRYLTSSFLAPSMILLQMTVGSSSPVNVYWDRLTISSTTNQAPSAPQQPFVDNTTARTGQTTPVFGLTDHTPAFSAIFDDPDTSDTASFYQLQVNTASDFSGTSMWDSTKTSISCSENTRCNDIIYAGSTLLDGTSYYWRLMFWDNSGVGSSWSAVQQFKMNSPPAVSGISLNAGQDINLIENSAIGISWSATITDADGYGNINQSLITGKVFRSGLTESCTQDNNNCYTSPTCNTSDCSGNSCTAICTANIYFFADPTDANSDRPSEYWQAQIRATDIRSEIGTTLTSPNLPDIISFSGLDVGSSLVYGALVPGDNTGTSNPDIILTNTGNRTLDSELKGDNLCIDNPCGSAQIPVFNQQFSLSTFTYGAGTTLSADYQAISIGLSKPTSSPSNSIKNIYWGIAIPANKESGAYSGIIEIYALPR